MNALLDAALAYAKQGRRVFPLTWPVKGECSCGQPCNSPAKHPCIKLSDGGHGLKDATTDEATIRGWWEKYPQANIGMLMGDGLITADVDPRHDGDDTLHALGDLPDTVTGLTGGGGRHLIYRSKEDYSNRPLGGGLDVRSADSYIVVAPSLHISGRQYEWETGCAPGELAPAPLPDVLKRLILEKQRNGERAADEIIPDGERSNTLISLGGTMRRRGMSPEAILAALQEDNANRCKPPLPDYQVQQIARSAANYTPAESPHAPDGPAGDTSPRGPVLAQLSRVQRREVAWLWQDRIPLGRLTGFVGDPGAGKSWLTLAVGAAVTKGAGLPGQESLEEPGNVLLLTAEDSLSDTVRPRIEDMGAGLDRVTALTAVRDEKGNEGHPSLLKNIPDIEAALAARGYKMVIIDPLNAYLGVNLDTHRDAALRAALTPLAALAERWGVAVVFVHHLNKGQRDRAIYRLQGSIAVVAAARVIHLVGMNPDAEGQRVFVNIKNNLALPPPPLAFELREGRFLWRGETTVTEAALLRPDEEEGGRYARDEAVGFLRIILADGPVEAKQVRREAREATVSDRTLERAKAELGVISQHRGEAGQQGGGAWVWALPGVKVATPPVSVNVATLPFADREQPPLGVLNGDLDPEAGEPS